MTWYDWIERDKRVAYFGYDDAEPELGTVVRWNVSKTLVFVLFDGDRQAKGVYPNDIQPA